MICEKVDLYEYFKVPREGNAGGVLQTYVPSRNTEMKERLRPAMLVVPGGGYAYVSARENECVAVGYLQKGYAAFVLTYTCNVPYPTPLVEAAMAMAYIRLNAKKYCVDPRHVAVTGFSAGGHLAGMLSTLFRDEAIKGALKEHASLVRPDAAVLCYPVLTMGEMTHEGTARVISGGDKTLREKLSIERCITKDSSPAFLWHTVEDAAVPVENSLYAAAAYRKCGVPFELHAFSKGEHGLSVISKDTYDGEKDEGVKRNAIWLDLAAGFLKTLGFEVKEV